jgi:glycerophosphoryl diester phosphodiesterase
LSKLGVDGVFSENPDVAVSVRTTISGDRGHR